MAIVTTSPEPSPQPATPDPSFAPPPVAAAPAPVAQRPAATVATPLTRAFTATRSDPWSLRLDRLVQQITGSRPRLARSIVFLLGLLCGVLATSAVRVAVHELLIGQASGAAVRVDLAARPPEPVDVAIANARNELESALREANAAR
jgi:hypothetical protein